MAIATHTHLTIRICVRMSGARARKGGVVNPFLARAPFPARAPNVRVWPARLHTPGHLIWNAVVGRIRPFLPLVVQGVCNQR